MLIAAASGAFTQQDKTKDAIENGDETLKGDAGTGIIDKLDGNVNANPNISDETKENASKADEGVDVDGRRGGVGRRLVGGGAVGRNGRGLRRCGGGVWIVRHGFRRWRYGYRGFLFPGQGLCRGRLLVGRTARLRAAP